MSVVDSRFRSVRQSEPVRHEIPNRNDTPFQVRVNRFGVLVLRLAIRERRLDREGVDMSAMSSVEFAQDEFDACQRGDIPFVMNAHTDDVVAEAPVSKTSRVGDRSR